MPALRTSDFTTGIPIELSFRTCEPRPAPSKFDKDEMSFMTSAGSIYLDAEAARDIYDQIRELQIVPNEKARIVKIKTSHGGHRWHVERPPSLERQLEDSLPNRPNRTAPASSHASAAGSQTGAHTTQQHSNGNTATPQPPAPKLTPAATCMCSAMCSAIDAVIETQAYATRRGIGVTFSEESVRAIALTIYIDMCRNGARS